MGSFLLHEPWIYFYLLYVAAWFVAFICPHPRKPPTTKDSSRAKPPANREGKGDVS